jgi:tetratricopeptide (TPR) repeat protein
VQALAAAPGDPFILARLAALPGEERYRHRLTRYFGEADAAFLLGRAHLELGHSAAALAELQRLTQLLPELYRGQFYLAAALGANGAWSQAADTYLAATAKRVDPAMLESWILPIFAAAAERAPGDAQVRYRHGLVLAQYGHFSQALAETRVAYGLEPAPAIRKVLEQLEKSVRQDGAG